MRWKVGAAFASLALAISVGAAPVAVAQESGAVATISGSVLSEATGLTVPAMVWVYREGQDSAFYGVTGEVKDQFAVQVPPGRYYVCALTEGAVHETCTGGVRLAARPRHFAVVAGETYDATFRMASQTKPYRVTAAPRLLGTARFGSTIRLDLGSTYPVDSLKEVTWFYGDQEIRADDEWQRFKKIDASLVDRLSPPGPTRAVFGKRLRVRVVYRGLSGTSTVMWAHTAPVKRDRRPSVVRPGRITTYDGRLEWGTAAYVQGTKLSAHNRDIRSATYRWFVDGKLVKRGYYSLHLRQWMVGKPLMVQVTLKLRYAPTVTYTLRAKRPVQQQPSFS